MIQYTIFFQIKCMIARNSILGTYGRIQLSKLPLNNFELIQFSAIPGMKLLSCPSQLCMVWFMWDKVQGVWSLGNRPFSSTSNRGVSSLASLPMLSVSKSSTPTVSPFNTFRLMVTKKILCHGYCPHLPESHWSFSYCHYWWNFEIFLV